MINSIINSTINQLDEQFTVGKSAVTSIEDKLNGQLSTIRRMHHKNFEEQTLKKIADYHDDENSIHGVSETTHGDLKQQTAKSINSYQELLTEERNEDDPVIPSK